MADIPYQPRAELYPEIEPYSAGTLKLDGVHAMYWEQSGNPEGAPVLFLHGGPGAGASPAHRRFFDPAHYRIVIFDQRGAGPLDAARRAARQHDAASRRRHRAAARSTSGSSAGSCSAARGAARSRSPTAKRTPTRCAGFILRGVFLCRASEIDWFLYGLRNAVPGGVARPSRTSYPTPSAATCSPPTTGA